MSDIFAKGLIGANTTHRTKFAEYKLGCVERGVDNKVMMYGKASELITKTGAAGEVLPAPCDIDLVTGLVTDNAAGDWTADTTFQVGEYGWVWKVDLV